MKLKEIILEYNLLEYNLQNILSLFQEKYKETKEKDSSNTHENLEDFIKSIENPLRQQNKFQFIEPYMKWIVQRYVTGKLNKYEDLMSKVIPGLLKYDSLKRKNKLKPEHKDINQIKDINNLLDILDQYREEDTKSAQEKEKEIEENFYKNGEAKLVYNDSDYKIVIPKSEKASCFFGRNTRWCTAATQGKNYFKSYSNKGNLYIIIIKKENLRFQFHFSIKQFMDEMDNPISILEFRKKYPKLEQIFSKIETSYYNTGFFKDLDKISEKEIIDFLENNPKDGVEILKKNPKYITKKEIISILRGKISGKYIFKLILESDLDINHKKSFVYHFLNKIMHYFYNIEKDLEKLFAKDKIKELFDDINIKERLLMEYPIFIIKYLNKIFLDEKDLEEIIKNNKKNFDIFIINLQNSLETEKIEILENFIKAARVVLKVALENQNIHTDSSLIFELFRMYYVWHKYIQPSKKDDVMIKKILDSFFTKNNYDHEKMNEMIKNLKIKYKNISYLFENFIKT